MSTFIFIGDFPIDSQHIRNGKSCRSNRLGYSNQRRNQEFLVVDIQRCGTLRQCSICSRQTVGNGQEQGQYFTLNDFERSNQKTRLVINF